MIETEQILNLLKNDYSKEMVVATISGIIGLTLSFFIKIIIAFKNNLNTSIDYIVGEWNIYNISFLKNKEIINKGKWVIRKSLLGGIKINIHYYDKEDNIIDLVKYTGIVYKEEGSIVVAIKGDKHSENVFCRLLSSNPSNIDYIYGIWLGKDLDYINSSAPLILTKKEASEEEIKNIINSNFKVENHAIRVIPNYAVL